MSRRFTGCILNKERNKWKDRKMLEVWKMFKVAEAHRNGRNV